MKHLLINFNCVGRSSLETQKLELLTELSSLRLKQVSLERENYELKEKCGGSGMKSSLSDLNYIDGAPNRNVVWDKPPVPAGEIHMNDLIKQIYLMLTESARFK